MQQGAFNQKPCLGSMDVSWFILYSWFLFAKRYEAANCYDWYAKVKLSLRSKNLMINFSIYFYFKFIWRLFRSSKRSNRRWWPCWPRVCCKDRIKWPQCWPSESFDLVWRSNFDQKIECGSGSSKLWKTAKTSIFCSWLVIIWQSIVAEFMIG